MHPTSHLARQLRQWTRRFMATKSLPTLHYQNAKRAMVEDEDIRREIKLHIQSVGKWFTADHIVEYSGRPEVLQRWGLTKAISPRTALRWLAAMKYQYGKEKKGMYLDGHEREDVVKYRQDVFIPLWSGYEKRMLLKDRQGVVTQWPGLGRFPLDRRVVLVTHDESTFYGNDQRQTRWQSSEEKPKPMRKGEGPSIMISDFCSPDFGWLRVEKEGSNSVRDARVVFKAGKNRDGYFDGDDFLAQVDTAIDVFEEKYPLGNVVGLFAFDNAPSHQRRAPNGLTARKIPKGTQFWLTPSGQKMRPGYYFKDQQRIEQPLYYADDHDDPFLRGKFKGMEAIIRERGLWPTDSTQKTALQELVESRGHLCIFYPKYHCELNFIEMVWGRAKYVYRMYEIASTEDEMEANVIQALESVTVEMMQRFSERSARFIDSYRQGLTGSAAVWANKKYHGHCKLPPNMKALAEKAVA
ncbi:hypothetical protein SISSUDRAFT_1072510 [Sistotremastrum suecicum HHB10207 ss-3]|uniref:Tc1-like transposase DDE domain-containing protein n=1 Tax=Sistotremastrum suecicum HHB10207 ss-3 TaxID=1314776 RepID=A0A165XT88_9AGAM|nr:hypothetical protein SISSUDRAFT_1072510 [Sistotremastrum suecicum HHB10207 ss-3]